MMYINFIQRPTPFIPFPKANGRKRSQLLLKFDLKKNKTKKTFKKIQKIV